MSARVKSKPIGPRKEICTPSATRERNARYAIAWMLHETGLTWAEVGAALGIGLSRAGELGRTYQYMLDRRLARVHLWDEPFARRLRAAGAIP
jgi:hypothetical protein